MSLKQKTFSAVRWTTLSTIGGSGLAFLQIAILARLLNPAEFGLMAIIMAVITFGQIFTDMGVSNAIIHYQDVSEIELSSLYWLNVVAGVILAVLLMLFAPIIVHFYAKPTLHDLLIVVSFNFIIISLGQQFRVIAEKELRFSEISKIELFSASIAFVVAVTWAVISPSVAALIAGMMVSSLMKTFLAWRILVNGWRPQLRFRLNEIRRFLSYGGYTMANNIVNIFNAQADIFIGGRFLSQHSLGTYSLPRDLSLRIAGVINITVTRVGLPLMAKAQNDKEFLKKIYLKTLRMTSSVNFPVYMAMSVFAPEIVKILFGSSWNDAVPLLRILAIWGLVRSTGNPVGSLIFSVGRADLAFKWNLGMLFIMPPTLWLGVHYGSQGIAYSLLILVVMLAIPGWYVLVRPLCNAKFLEYFSQTFIPLVISVVSSVAAFLSVLGIDNAIIRLSLGVMIGGVVYIILSRWFNRTWFETMLELLMHRTNKMVANDEIK